MAEGTQVGTRSCQEQIDELTRKLDGVRVETFGRVMESVNEVLNQTIDEFKEAMREEVRRETQTVVALAKKELEELAAGVIGQLDKVRKDTLRELKAVSSESSSLISRSGKRVDEAIKAGLESGMVEITTTVEKYKKHIETAGSVLATFRRDMDKLRSETTTAVTFVKDLAGRGYTPEIMEKQFRDRVSDVASLQGQINGLRKAYRPNGHRNGGLT